MTPLSGNFLTILSGSEVGGTVLLSLLLQIILIIFGSRRKYTGGTGITILVWSTYLTADWVATFSLGLIARSQGDFGRHNSSKSNNSTLHAFWAPFLLLHLGGPDTITSYSIEDNELWSRHLYESAVQVGTAFYVLMRSLKSSSALSFLAIPMLITGIIKYGERTYVQWVSSADKLKASLCPSPDPGPDILGRETVIPVNLASAGTRTGQAVPVRVENSSCINPEDDYLAAYFLFKRFRYLFADLILGYHEQKESYDIIHKRSATNAFKLVAIQLGFMYDLLYTKAKIVYSRFGVFIRCICCISHVSVSVVFLLTIHKHGHSLIDIAITWVLLLGAVFFEVYSFIKLTLFSDRTKLWWTKLKNTERGCIFNCICWNSLLLINSRRWSRSLGQNNLLSICLECLSAKTCTKRVQNIFRLKEIRDLTWKDVNDDLEAFIFNQLLKKGKQIQERDFDMQLCKELLGQRGDYVLSQRSCLDEFRWSTVDVEFDHSLLLWHVATSLCYYDDLDNNDADDLHVRCKISKCLSDYMLYLLVLCPTMLPKGLGETRYRDTCAEARRFFKLSSSLSSHKSSKSSKIRKACREIFQVNTDCSLERRKGDKCKSVLFFGCRLAKQLQALEFEDDGRSNIEQKWEMISEIWMEMLAYAASRCEWKEHAQQLRKGGELLTHISLLMAQLGLSEKYQVKSRYLYFY